VNDDLEDKFSGSLPPKDSTRKQTKKETPGLVRQAKLPDADKISSSLPPETPAPLRQENPGAIQDTRKEISGFLRQESISTQRSKEEKIAALLALGSYLDDKDSARFLRQESFSQKRSLEERVAALRALGGRQ
jgi:hypothetical protein